MLFKVYMLVNKVIREEESLEYMEYTWLWQQVVSGFDKELSLKYWVPMMKIKTKKIKQSLLWEDDKWAACGRRVVVTSFNPYFCDTMLQMYMYFALKTLP